MMLFRTLFMNAAAAVTEAVETAAEAAAETVAGTASSGFTFAPGNFISNLYYMGTGMLAIFIVIAVIICMVYVLDVIVKAFSVKLPKR